MPSLTPTSAFNCNSPAFSFAPRVPHDYNLPRLPWAICSPQYTHAHSLLKSISAFRCHPIWTHTFFWTGYWTKSGQELQMCWPASQEVCNFWLASCTGYMHALHIKAITAASQPKQTICKPDIMVTEGRRAWDFRWLHAKSEQACLTNHQASNFLRKGDERWHHLLMILGNTLKLVIWTVIYCSKFKTQTFEMHNKQFITAIYNRFCFFS